MNLSPQEDLARLVPFVRAWEEAQDALKTLLGLSTQLIPIHWDGSHAFDLLQDELCPLLQGHADWRSQSQSYHYRKCIEVLCGGSTAPVLLFSCYCGLSHLVFPLKIDDLVSGAVLCSAVKTQLVPAKEVNAFAGRARQGTHQVAQSLDLLRHVTVDELLRRGRQVATKIPSLEEAFAETTRSADRKTSTEGGLKARSATQPMTLPQESAAPPTPAILSPSAPSSPGQSLEIQRPEAQSSPLPQAPSFAVPGSRPHAGKRRVVVTGLGVVSSVGIGKEAFAEALRQGRNGIGPITLFDPEAMSSRIAGEVKNFRPEDYLDSKAIKRTGRSTQFAVAAAKQAIQDSGIACGSEDPNRIGVIVGSAAGGLEFGQDQMERYLEDGGKAISPFLSIVIFAGACSSEVSIELRAKGPSITVSTGCAASNDAIGYALQFIRDDRADIMIAGGTEAPIFPVMHASFCSLRALSTRNSDPEHASRPFDRDRDGFVIAEGSAMVVMEELGRARARGARIYGEILGYAATGDAFHMTRPSPDGVDATRAIQLAIQDSGLAPEEIQYISAHGSSTPLNDRTETAAIKSVFGRRAHDVPVSSTKSMLGHSIGASGALNLVATFLGMHDSFMPPTTNLEHPDPECDLDYVANRSRDQRFEVALSNNFGFGGKNACIVVSKW